MARHADEPLLAAITVYQPDEGLLAALIERLIDDGLAVALYIDGPVGHAVPAAFYESLVADPRLRLVLPAANGGVGRGLTAMAVLARAEGYREVLYLDQDSSPPPGLGAALAIGLRSLRAAGLRPAAIGPQPVAPGNAADMKPPKYRHRTTAAPEGLVATDYIITSGSLVDLDALEAVGQFREDYVIDAIDTEWCFRAWDRHYGIYLAKTVLMPHRIGDGVLRLGPLTFPRQSEKRMLTYVRNQVHGLRLPHVPAYWKARLMVYLPVQMLAFLLLTEASPGRVKRMAKAVLNGVTGRLGHLP